MTPEWKKELEEALAVTNRVQNKHALMIEDHERWLETVQKVLLETSESAREAHQLIDQIAAKQLAAEERQDELEKGLKELQSSMKDLQGSMKAFIDSMRRGGNGQA